MTLPRLDPYLERIGEPLEDLSRIAASQPYESLGPRSVARGRCTVWRGAVAK